ncbi:hypothetical protein SISSUDRAFT_1133292 [Sistotremastrum suecicum HHB10207 ss-3]|uniref:Secreted protein n=1 Tax=Sistotremastrum suecicum HHB10207 ss-3 TaxID=1314776 RepID=A0A165XHR8_9AGAM|nr:hypothetical protein SISSUDRAFT_1133292 [Sistotremastrum suecicum HHB10207 ss-3]
MQCTWYCEGRQRTCDGPSLVIALLWPLAALRSAHCPTTRRGSCYFSCDKVCCTIRQLEHGVRIPVDERQPLHDMIPSLGWSGRGVFRGRIFP